MAGNSKSFNTRSPGGIHNQMETQDYQVKLMLLAMIQNSKKFQVSSETQGAGCFDDIVVKTDQEYLLIQAKCQIIPMKLSKTNFITSKGNFCIPKYFESFVDLRKKFDPVANVVICTNNTIDFENDSLTVSGGGNLILKLFDHKTKFFDGISCVSYKVDEIDGKNLITKLCKKNVNDEAIDEFLEKFILTTSLFSDEIDGKVENFLKENFNLKNVTYLRELLENNVRKWLQKGIRLSYRDIPSDWFEDVMLKVDGKYWFFRIVDEDNPELMTTEAFLSENSDKFCLYEYFKGFVDIKRQCKNIESVVLCTNSKIADVHLFTKSSTSNRKNTNEEILNLMHKIRYQIKTSEETRKRIAETFQKLANGNQREIENITRNLDEFIEKFYIFENFQVSVDKIQKLLADEISLEREMGDIKLTVINELRNWFKSKNKAIEYYTEKDFNEFLQEIYKKNIKLQRLIGISSDIFSGKCFEFTSNTLDSIHEFVKEIEDESNGINIFHMKTEEGEYFYGAKMIRQVLGSRRLDTFLFAKSSDFKEAWSTFWEYDPLVLLIIIFDEDFNNFMKYKNEIGGKVGPNKRILLISDKNFEDLIHSFKKTNFHTITIGNVLLNQLSSIEFVLNKIVDFQGKQFTEIGDLVEAHVSFLDTVKLGDVKKTEKIGGNVVWLKNFDDIVYVERKFKHKNILEQNVFESLRGEQTEKITTIETDYEDYCKKYPDLNVHFLLEKPQTQTFQWIKTRGRIEKLIKFTVSEKGTDVLWSFPSNEKVFLIVDIPGMGKFYDR